MLKYVENKKTYVEICGKYEGICRKYAEICRNMWEIWTNMKELWRNVQKYVFGEDRLTPLKYRVRDLEKFWPLYLCRLWDFEEFRTLLYLGLEKIPSTLPPPWFSLFINTVYGLWKLEKVRALPSLCTGSGTWGNSELTCRYKLEKFHLSLCKRCWTFWNNPRSFLYRLWTWKNFELLLHIEAGAQCESSYMPWVLKKSRTCPLYRSRGWGIERNVVWVVIYYVLELGNIPPPIYRPQIWKNSDLSSLIWRRLWDFSPCM